MKAPLPDNEAQRIEALREYGILDTSAEDSFDDLTRLASFICGTPIALVSLVDTNRQWFKSKVGLEALETPRDVAFCAHAILQPDVFMVPDATADERFATNPLVTDGPNIQFYAGVPLVDPQGHAVGTLCVIDQVPRNLSPEQVEALRSLGRQVLKQMEWRRHLASLTLVTSEHKQAKKIRRQFFKRVAGGLGLASAILVLIGGISYQSIKGLIQSNYQVAQTETRLNKLKEIFSEMMDAETAQRGYLITGEESYLEPYSTALGKVEQEISRLRQLTGNNPKQQRQLDALKPLIVAKFNFLKQTIELRRNQETEAALQLIRTNEGKRLMDNIRQIIRELENEENELLDQQSAVAKASGRQTLITLAIALFLTFILLCWVYFLIYREISERQETEESLKQERNFISAVVDTASALVVVLDPEGKIVRFNRACEQTTGYSAEEVIGRYFWNLFLVPEEVEAVKASFAELRAGHFPNEHQNYWVTKEGSRRRIAWSNTALLTPDGAVKYIIGTGTDITERKRTERRLNAQHAVTRILAESTSLQIATPKILQAICLNLGWDVGEFWNVDSSANVLRCLQSWHLPSLKIPTFEAVTQQTTFSPGMGLPGRVWVSGEPSWITNVVQDESFLRAQIAAQVGLHAAFGFPIQSGNEILGVITFFSCEIQPPDTELLQMMAAIGSQIGQFIKRKRAEEASRESEEKYRSVVNNVKEVIFQTDATGNWTFLNPAWTEITDFSIDESIGTNFLDYIHPDDRQLNQERFQSQIQRKKEYYRHETRYITQDGSYRWMEVYTRLILDGDDSIIGTSGTLNDITERRRTQEALRLSQERYELAISSGDVGVWDWDITADEIYIDPTIKAALGYTELDIPNTLEGWRSLLHPEDLERVLEATNAHLEGKTFQYEIEHRRLHKDGSIRWFLSRGTAFQDAEGQMCRMTGTDTDITKRKQFEEALKRERRQLQQIIATAPVAMAMFDTQMRYLAHSRKWSTDYNLEEQSLIGRSLYEVFPDLPERWKAIYQLALKGQAISNPEDVLEREDGSKVYLRWAVQPWRDADGSVGGIVLVTDMINELVEAREAALKASQFKSEFLANMSHEIRTPMNAVLGMTGLLLDTPLSPEQQDFVETMRISGNALLSLINEILDLSKLEAGEMELEILDFDLSSCIEEVLELLAPQAHAKGLEIAALIDPNVPIYLQGDAGRLRQILMNLTGNAIKFTNTGEVIVQVQLKSETPTTATINLAVIDMGIGIAPEDQAKLFTSFTQVDASTTRKYGGTGLGLAICKQLVGLMGGEIGVESQLGQGAKFWFTVSLSKQRQPVSSAEEIGYLTGRRLLVVDNNATNRQVIRHHANRWGMQMDEADSAAAAFTALLSAEEQKQPFDLAFIDTQIPEIDGLTLGEQIKRNATLAKLPLILLTSTHQRDEYQRALNIGFAAYLVKPVKSSRLLDTLMTVLEGQEEVMGGQWAMGNGDEILLPIASSPSPKCKLRILLAEDNPVNQKVALKQLKNLGYEADVVGNGQEVLQLLEKVPYDLILMDCQMPVLDGFETTREIHRRFENLETLEATSPSPNLRRPVVIAMTANAMREDQQKCLNAGMDDYLSKPVSKEQLIAVLERWYSSFVSADDSLTAESTISLKEVDSLVPIDWEPLHQLSNGDAEFELELLQMFVADTKTHLQTTETAIKNHDFQLLEREAHHLKGASANVGATAMHLSAEKLEKLAQRQQMEGATDLLADLEQLLNRIQAFLKAK